MFGRLTCHTSVSENEASLGVGPSCNVFFCAPLALVFLSRAVRTL